MHKKIIGIFVCMLLIVTVIPVSGNIKEISISNDRGNSINPLSNGDKWMKTYDFSIYDIGESVQQTSDSGYIILGVTTPFLRPNF